MIDQLIGHLYPGHDVEGEIDIGIIGSEDVGFKGNALNQRIPAAAGIDGGVVGQEGFIAVFRVGAHGGCAVMVRQAAFELGEGDFAVPVVIGGEVPFGGDGTDQRTGKVSGAGQPFAVDIPGPEPALLRAAGGADDDVILACKYIGQLGVHALAQHGAGMAGVNDEHLFAADLIEHRPEHPGGDGGFPFAVGEQQRHLAGGHAFLPDAVGADVEITHIVLVCGGKGVEDHRSQIAGGGQALGTGHEDVEFHRAAAERFLHADDVVVGGGRRCGLGKKAVAADQQRPVDAAVADLLRDADIDVIQPLG